MSLSAESRLELFAPMNGPVIPLEQVPDPVFSQRLVGDGIAIDPTSQVLLSPCAGKIVNLHPANHAVTVASASGAQILLHIGLDTVNMKGNGFSPKVKVGDQVAAGQPLIEFDADYLAARVKSLISVMVLAEAPAHQLKRPHVATAIAARDVLLELALGDAKSAAPAAAPAPAGPKAQSRAIEIKLPTGLHARPAAQLVGLAKTYKSKVEIHKGSQVANAKSIVSLLGLAIGHQDFVQFRAEGPDAQKAVDELVSFLQNLKDHPAPAPAAKAPTGAAQPARAANVIAGVAASPGVAIGRVQRLFAQAFDITENAANPADEKTTLAMALSKATADLEALKSQVTSKTDAAQAAIFAAHQELLEDPDLVGLASDLIDQGKSAAFAWDKATSTHAERLAHLNNELMANRANDLRDVGRRVLRILVGRADNAPLKLNADTILIAENLTPSDTVQLDREKVLGFCTTTGGATSHVAILARSLGLPAIAGIEARALDIADGTEVVLDGDRGEIRLNPGPAEKEQILARQREQLEKRKTALASAAQPATTKDGHTVEVAANIGGVADAQEAVKMGGDGVGLLRSEFLFLERATAPSEEEQFRVYQEIADTLGNRPLVIRTLDVGGDKPLQYLPLGEEENPFLGVRGLRVGFRHPEILREQLRAILRVKHQGALNVMFPMVATLEEFRQAKAMLEEERARLGAAPVKVGIMIEVPSAALIADAFAPEVDFFSIGTNDLTQYTLAMDRGHKDLAKQVDGLHPSVLKLIEMTVQAAHKHGKWVGVCGGLASDASAVPVLLGLGVDELSVSLPVIPLVKSQVRESTLQGSKTLAQNALAAPNAKVVRDLSAAHH